MSELKTILAIENLSVQFINNTEVVKVIDEINFVLEEGKILGVVGESGSGKTVTALAIMQLLQKKNTTVSGKILFYKNDVVKNLITRDANKGRNSLRGKEVTMIFQEPMTSLNPVLSCGHQVSEAIQWNLNLSAHEAKRKTVEVFNRVKLPGAEDIYNSYPHQLSGGQKQRVMIAMAICCNPSILIADEPTSSLDVTTQSEILELLKEIQAETGMSIIFITHDLGILSSIANDIVVMRYGKVVEKGTVKEVFESPYHAYTQKLLSCRLLLNNQTNSAPGTRIKKEDIYMKEPFLRIEKLAKKYQITNKLFSKPKSFINAVDDLSFELYKGETLGIVGASGSGKTTLGKMLVRLINPSKGRVIYKGTDIVPRSDNEMQSLRKSMQIIFQDPFSSLNPRLTIGRMIMEPMQVHQLHDSDKERKAKTIELLKKVNLKEEHFNRYPHEFSGGQRQRIGIARALAVNPEFIICDEAVSSLDALVQVQILDLLNQLKEDFGLTYMFISHDLSVVRFMSNRIMVMNNGKIEEIGTTEEIYSNPKSTYTRQLLASTSKFQN